MSNRDAQEEELCALKYIFDEEFKVSEANKVEGKYFAHPDLPSNFKVKWQDLKEKDLIKEMNVQFLPPIVLSFTLPEDYPLESPPVFSLTCEWMSGTQISSLCGKLYRLWSEDKDVILYKWASFLKEESLHFLNIVDELDVSALLTQSFNGKESCVVAGTSSLPSGSSGEKQVPNNESTFVDDEKYKGVPQSGMLTGELQTKLRKVSGGSKGSLLKTIQEHNKEKQQEAFNREVFDCNVCFIPTIGSKCIQFQPCQHVFCKRCVKEYVEVAIREGRVQNLSCLEVDCKSPVLQYHVKELVSSELFISYDQLLLTVSLTSMSDVTYCPFASCETPVLFDPNDSMASCPSCNYVFCIHCKMGYHGVEPCRIRTKDKAKLVREYLSGSEAEKKDFEKRYGRRPLQILVNNVMSQQWIDANSKPCPKCSAHIEKFDGCNKMQCWRCMSNFCWLCTKLILDPDPYVHFSSPNSKCKGLLFHGLPAEVYEFDRDHFNDEVNELSDDDDDDDELYFGIDL